MGEEECGLTGKTEKLAAWDGIGAAAVHLGGELGKLGQVALELRLFHEDLPHGGERGGQFRRRRGGERIDPPWPALCDGDQTMPAQVGEVAGDFRLRQPQHGLEVADAQRLLRQQVEEAKPGGVAQAAEEVQQFHGRSQEDNCIFAKANMIGSLYWAD